MITAAAPCGPVPAHKAYTAVTPDGLGLAVQDWGQGFGGVRRDVLFIHGFSQSHLCWLHQVASPLKEKYRLVVEGPPNYTSFRQFWKMFYDEGAVVVASSYTKVGGVYDFGFRHDPDKPLETLAEYCLGVYTNRSLPMRIDMLVNYINEYEADGLLINSIKSCNSFSAGQLLMMREVEKRTGKPAAFVESDLVDPRYFSAANIKNRLESYFQMIDQKRAGVDAAA